MSNDNQFERLWKLQAKVNMLVLDGKRDPQRIANIYQEILQGSVRVSFDEKSSILPINRATPFNPTGSIGNGWTIWKGPINGNGDGLTGEEEQDKRSLALTELKLADIRLETGLVKKETSIKGETKLARLKKAGHIRLDAAIFETLWENQHLIPHQWKKETNGSTMYVYFDGTALRSPDGYRCVLYLCWDGDRWYRDCSWLENDWLADRPSAVLVHLR